jgi:hypothetical protein
MLSQHLDELATQGYTVLDGIYSALRRGPTRRLRDILLAITYASLMGCQLSSDCGDWADSGSYRLDVNANLLAVTYVAADEADPFTRLAVGEAGTVVAWGFVIDSAEEPQLTVELSTLASADLNDVATVNAGWWVVGNGGFAAVSGDRGLTWTPVELAGATADLHAIINLGSRLIVAGDGTLVVQSGDGTWAPASEPSSGWGQFRQLYFDGSRVYAAGRDGMIVSALDPGGEWVVESSGGVDLAAIGRLELDEWSIVAVGSGGTLLVREGDEWLAADTGVQVDLVAVGGHVALGVNGDLFEVNREFKLSRIDTLPDARAMILDRSGNVLTVGDNATVTTKGTVECEAHQ